MTTWRPLLLACLFLAAPAAARPLDAVKESGVLRVGTTGDYKPFTFREPDGHYEGADIAMAEHLAKRLGVRVEFVPTTWAHLLDDFKADRFDVAMGGVSVLPDRAAAGAFSTVLLVDGKRPVVRCADRERFTSVEAIDRPDVRVVVNPGASNEAFARAKLPHAQLTVHGDNATVFDEIAAGRADVMVTDGTEVDHQAAIHPELCAADVKAPFTKVEKAYLLPRDPAMVEAVDAWLADETRSGDWKRVLDAALRRR